MKFVYNNVWLENFFLKIMMMYDHTNNLTTTSNHYGDTVIGSSFRYVSTQLDDTKVTQAGS